MKEKRNENKRNTELQWKPLPALIVCVCVCECVTYDGESRDIISQNFTVPYTLQSRAHVKITPAWQNLLTSQELFLTNKFVLSKIRQQN